MDASRHADAPSQPACPGWQHTPGNEKAEGNHETGEKGGVKHRFHDGERARQELYRSPGETLAGDCPGKLQPVPPQDEGRL